MKAFARPSCYEGEVFKSFLPYICIKLWPNIEYLSVSLQVQSRCGSNENILRASKYCVCVYLCKCVCLREIYICLHAPIVWTRPPNGDKKKKVPIM